MMSFPSFFLDLFIESNFLKIIYKEGESLLFELFVQFRVFEFHTKLFRFFKFFLKVHNEVVEFFDLILWFL